MVDDADAGTNLIARGGIVLCALALLWVYFAGGRDASGDMVFLVALLFLTVSAFFR